MPNALLRPVNPNGVARQMYRVVQYAYPPDQPWAKQRGGVRGSGTAMLAPRWFMPTPSGRRLFATGGERDLLEFTTRLTCNRRCCEAQGGKSVEVYAANYPA